MIVICTGGWTFNGCGSGVEVFGVGVIKKICLDRREIMKRVKEYYLCHSIFRENVVLHQHKWKRYLQKMRLVSGFYMVQEVPLLSISS